MFFSTFKSSLAIKQLIVVGQIIILSSVFAQKNKVKFTTLVVEDDIDLVMTPDIRIGLRLEYENGKRRKTKGLLHGNKGWENYQVECNYGTFENGTIILDRKAAFLDKNIITLAIKKKESGELLHYREIQLPLIDSVEFVTDSDTLSEFDPNKYRMFLYFDNGKKYVNSIHGYVPLPKLIGNVGFNVKGQNIYVQFFDRQFPNKTTFSVHLPNLKTIKTYTYDLNYNKDFIFDFTPAPPADCGFCGTNAPNVYLFLNEATTNKNLIETIIFTSDNVVSETVISKESEIEIIASGSTGMKGYSYINGEGNGITVGTNGGNGGDVHVIAYNDISLSRYISITNKGGSGLQSGSNGSTEMTITTDSTFSNKLYRLSAQIFEEKRNSDYLFNQMEKLFQAKLDNP